MSFDLNKIYDDIKTQISDLPIVKAHSIEHFSLPPYPEDLILPDYKELLEKHPDDISLQDVVKYDIKHREVYDVIDDFDQSPSDLSKEKVQLRKKYLNIILSIINERAVIIKTKLNDPNSLVKIHSLENYDPAVNTMKRIIKLLIMEIDGPTCPEPKACPVCPKPEPCPLCDICKPCPVCPTPEPCPVCPKPCPKFDNKYYIYTILALIISLVIMSIALINFK